ncbi:MAG: glutathione S-transferase [Roseobacter sp.]|jgi:glutathione S-transferase
MTYDLFIGNRLFSSWSLRGWLMLEKFGLPCTVHVMDLYGDGFAADMAPLDPARLVPVLRTPEGDIIGESLAIAETLAERHPDAGLWPRDPSLRARARWLCAEVASGFSALRSECPMQLKGVNAGFRASDAVLADLDRLQKIWHAARQLANHDGPWLLGEYSLADVFYTPVAARITGYDLRVSERSKKYCNDLLSDQSVREWRAAALEKNYAPFPYPVYQPVLPWPVG